VGVGREPWCRWGWGALRVEFELGRRGAITQPGHGQALWLVTDLTGHHGGDMYLRDATHQCNTVSTHLAHCVRWPWRVSAGLSKELRDSDTPHRVAADLTAAGDGSSAAILRTDVDG
jgi:hypothetical protein